MTLWYQEIKIILRLITWHKIKNYCLLVISFYLSRLLKKPIIWAYPYAVSIEPTTACNLGCPACPSGLKEFTRPTGNMKQETFQKIFLSLKKYLLHINFYFQGEPLIHPKIFDYIHTASQNKVYTLISTNAHFLSKENCEKLIRSGLHKIIISIDGLTQEVYEQYRVNGNIDKVWEGIDNLREAKEKLQSKLPIIVLQWIVFEHNLHQLPAFIDYCKKQHLHYQIKTAQVYTIEQLQMLVPKHSKYSRYVRDDNHLKLKNTLDNHCWRMWASCVFTIDGSIVPCCFDKDAKYSMGNIMGNHFSEIWTSPAYQTFRKNILHHRGSVDICVNCSEGSKVWV
ncbi:MAG: radical SAM/SPASM domain-containing protein [Bacteroidia bacterium]